MTKKISKVIVYYEDGTYEEIASGLSDLSNKKDKEDVIPVVVNPYPSAPMPWPTYPVWNTKIGTDDNVALRYTSNEDGSTWTFTSANNFDEYKYTIATNSNGNVDLSK